MDGEMGIEKAIVIQPEGHAVSLLDTMDDILGGKWSRFNRTQEIHR